MKRVYYPGRLFLIVPVVVLAVQFTDVTLVMAFSLIMGAVTAKIFPYAENIPDNKDTK